MATYQIELNTETENLLQNLIQQTRLSVSELMTQGLLMFKNNVGLTAQKPEVRFFDIYSQLDIGKEDNCAYSAAFASAGVKAILQQKLIQGKI
jgi:hypothetical protein